MPHRGIPEATDPRTVLPDWPQPVVESPDSQTTGVRLDVRTIRPQARPPLIGTAAVVVSRRTGPAPAAIAWPDVGRWTAWVNGAMPSALPEHGMPLLPPGPVFPVVLLGLLAVVGVVLGRGDVSDPKLAHAPLTREVRQRGRGTTWW